MLSFSLLMFLINKTITNECMLVKLITKFSCFYSFPPLYVLTFYEANFWYMKNFNYLLVYRYDEAYTSNIRKNKES